MDIILKNVDPELLEQQRLALHDVLDCLKDSKCHCGDLEALTGVLNMLDAWSDERHTYADEITESRRLEALDIKAEMKRSIRGRG